METPVAPVKFVPVINTTVPTGPEPGEMLVIVGAWLGASTTKLEALVADPDAENALIGPETAPTGTVNVKLVPFPVVKLETDAPPTLTDEIPVRFTPFTVTTVPGAPELGENEVMAGGVGET